MFNLIKKIYSRLSIYRSRIIISLVLSIAGTIISIIVPQFIRYATDEIAAGIIAPMNIEAVLYYMLTALVLLISGCVLTFIQNILLVSVSQLMGKDLRAEMNDKIDKIPLSYFDTKPIGDIMSRITTDIDTMVTALTNNLSSLVTAIIVIVSVTAIMLYMNVMLALVVVVVSAVFLYINKFMMQKSLPYFIKQQTIIGTINSIAEESFNGHIVIKAFNAEEKVKASFNKNNDELYRSAWHSQFIGGIMFPVTQAGGMFAQFLIIAVASYFILGGINTVTLGVMVVFMNYAGMFSNMLSNLSQLSSFLQPALASAQRIFEVLEEPEMTSDSKNVPDIQDIKGNVAFNGVKFGYVPGQIIIHGFNAEIKSGQKVAIVGPTGAGKSTIMNLLMRFYELNDGKILFDGVPIKDIPYRKLHEFIGIVPQEVWTFEGTIRENIIYSSSGVTEERFNEVLRASGLDYFVNVLPEGVDTVIDDTTSLSLGQKQLITIARAMIKNSPVLILDEATSSVDTRTEKIIQSALDTLMKGRTSFVIAHRLSTIRDADLILVMKDGDIAETGTHEELLAKKGLYADLYNSQFSVNL